MYVCMYVSCTHVLVTKGVRLDVCMHAYIRTHIHTHIHTHEYIHVTYVHAQCAYIMRTNVACVVKQTYLYVTYMQTLTTCTYHISTSHTYTQTLTHTFGNFEHVDRLSILHSKLHYGCTTFYCLPNARSHGRLLCLCTPCMCLHMYVRVCTYKSSHIFHTYIYLYIHTYIHILG
jgi:hypothetical protein